MAEKVKQDRCEFCEGKVERRVIRARFQFMGQTIYVDNVPTWVCTKCHEQYFDAPVYKRLGGFRERLYPLCYAPGAFVNRPNWTDIGDLGCLSLGYSFQEIALEEIAKQRDRIDKTVSFPLAEYDNVPN